MKPPNIDFTLPGLPVQKDRPRITRFGTFTPRKTTTNHARQQPMKIETDNPKEMILKLIDDHFLALQKDWNELRAQIAINLESENFPHNIVTLMQDAAAFQKLALMNSPDLLIAQLVGQMRQAFIAKKLQQGATIESIAALAAGEPPETHNPKPTKTH